MTFDLNDRDVLAKLWKDQHNHDGEDFQEQITIIQETIERQGDEVSVAGSGAFAHLVRATAQTISSDGEAIEWDTEGFDGTQEFSVTLPATSVTIPKSGYYNIGIAFDWTSFTGGGTVWIVRTRDGLPETVYPEDDDPGVWSSTVGSVFVETAHAIECLVGDELAVFVDPGDTNQELSSATLAVYLVDRVVADAVASSGLTDAVVSYSNDETTHTVTMTTAQEAGDMMLMFLVASSLDEWVSYPTGWTLLQESASMAVLYKVSDGTETDVTVDTTDVADTTAHAVWVVQSSVDYSANAPTAPAFVTSSVPSINPPAVTPSQGAGNYMIFPVVGRNGGAVQVSDGPDGYAMLLNTYALSGGTSSHMALEVFEAKVPVETSADPSLITWESQWLSEGLRSTTVAVKI